MFEREHLAGAAEAGLDFIDDQQDGVLVAELAQRLHEGHRSHVEAALALHQFDDDGGDALRVDIGLEQVLQALERIIDADAMQIDRERCVVHVGRQRAEVELVRRDLAGERHRHHGAAMEGAAERDDTGAPGGGACDLDGVLDRLGPGGKQRRLLGVVSRRDAIDPLRERDIRLVGHDLEHGVGKLA